MAGAPALFRIILQVSDLDKAAEFYATLLADEGRRIPSLSRRVCALWSPGRHHPGTSWDEA